MKITGGLYDPRMWASCKVTLNFVGRVCGSVPASEELVEKWLDSRKPSVRPPSGKSIAQLAEEVINRLPDIDLENQEIEKRTTLVFEQVDGVMAVRAATLRAHIKDCTNQVQNQFIGVIGGERNFTTRVKNGLYVGEGLRDNGTELVPFLRDGNPIKEIDGFQDRPVHFKTPRGEVSALKRFAYLLRPSLKFTVFILGKSVRPEDLQTILQYGAVHGYGGERSMQEGQYTYEIEFDENHLASIREMAKKEKKGGK